MEEKINLEAAEKENWSRIWSPVENFLPKLLRKEKTNLCNTVITFSPYFYLLDEDQNNRIHTAFISSSVNI